MLVVIVSKFIFLGETILIVSKHTGRGSEVRGDFGVGSSEELDGQRYTVYIVCILVIVITMGLYNCGSNEGLSVRAGSIRIYGIR